MAAQDLTSLGPHRIPVRRYEEFEHFAYESVAEVAALAESQNSSLVRPTTVAETTTAQDASFASIVGEAVYPPRTDLGAHRLPRRLYESFPHGVTNTGAIAESAVAVATQLALGVQGVTVVEATAGSQDTVASQSSLPDTVAEVAAYADAIDAALTRFGALVSTQGPMGMPRQRWVDFIHPAAVEEVTNLIDVHDASIPGEITGFVGDFLTLTDATNAGAIYHEAVVDALALFEDSATTGSLFVQTITESASLVDSVGADIQAVDVAVHEVNTLVDIQVVSSSALNGFVFDNLNLQDIPGVAGELYESVNEVLSALAFADIPGAFVPGVNIDGVRTVHIPEEIRVLEVETEVEMV